MNDALFRLAPALALCLPQLALAQAGQPDPADPKSSAPALRYQSAFSDYKPWLDIKPGNWREANDTVGSPAAKDGEHAGRDVPASVPAAPDPASKTTPAAIPGHGAHQHHGGKP